MFDILWIGPKTQSFVPANITTGIIEHYNLLTLYHFHEILVLTNHDLSQNHRKYTGLLGF